MRGSRKQHEDKQRANTYHPIDGVSGSIALAATAGTVSTALGTVALGPVVLGVGACALGGLLIGNVLENLFSE